jgi:transcriptional regulator with XRE-family HTH domain
MPWKVFMAIANFHLTSMVHMHEGNIINVVLQRTVGALLWHSAKTMATTLLSVETREVVRCAFPGCGLMQYRTSNSLCRRCRKPLETEEAVRFGPVVVENRSVDPSREAGLKVAGQVKEIRRQRHMSQRQLAGRMQVPRTYISKIENGKAIPTLSSLERMADALNVDIRQLVRDARSQREEDVASILTDPFLAEIAALLPELNSIHRSLVLGQVRDMAMGRRRTA